MVTITTFQLSAENITFCLKNDVLDFSTNTSKVATQGSDNGQ